VADLHAGSLGVFCISHRLPLAPDSTSAGMCRVTPCCITHPRLCNVAGNRRELKARQPEREEILQSVACCLSPRCAELLAPETHGVPRHVCESGKKGHVLSKVPIRKGLQHSRAHWHTPTTSTHKAHLQQAHTRCTHTHTHLRIAETKVQQGLACKPPHHARLPCLFAPLLS